MLAITKQPTLSKVVQRMETEGLVARSGVRADRRQTRAVITTKGRHLIGALCEQAMQHQKAVLAPFGEDQAALLIDMLRRLMADAAGRRRIGALRPRQTGGGRRDGGRSGRANSVYIKG